MSFLCRLEQLTFSLAFSCVFFHGERRAFPHDVPAELSGRSPVFCLRFHAQFGTLFILNNILMDSEVVNVIGIMN